MLGQPHYFQSLRKCHGFPCGPCLIFPQTLRNNCWAYVSMKNAVQINQGLILTICHFSIEPCKRCPIEAAWLYEQITKSNFLTPLLSPGMPLKYTNWSLFCVLDKHCSFSVPPAKQTHLPHMDTQTHIQRGALSSAQCVYAALVTVCLTRLRDLQPRQTRPVWQRAERVAFCGTAHLLRVSCFFFFLTTKLLRNHRPGDPRPDPEWPLETPRENGKKGAACLRAWTI